MITEKWSDKAKAKSMVESAIRGISFIESIDVSEQSGASIIREVYECFRMLGDAILTAKGLEAKVTDHHKQMIEELIKLNLRTNRPANLLHELRKIRHKLNYEGYFPSEAEVKHILEIKESLWKPILAEVKRIIEI